MIKKYKIIKEKFNEYFFVVTGAASILFHYAFLSINKLEKIDLKIDKFWIIPAITAYVYAATILTEYGYNSYFNIPPNFIEASITDNIIYFYDLIKLIFGIIFTINWWQWVMIIFTFFMIALFYSHRAIIAIMSLVLLFCFYNLGWFFASIHKDFYVLSDCLSIDSYKSYIIPTFYQGKAILISYDEKNKKMKASFLVKDIFELGCTIEQKEIGRMVR